MVTHSALHTRVSACSRLLLAQLLSRLARIRESTNQFTELAACKLSEVGKTLKQRHLALMLM